MTSIDIPTKKSSTVDNPEANLGNESGGIFACLKRGKKIWLYFGKHALHSSAHSGKFYGALS